MKSIIGILVAWLLTASALLGNPTLGTSKYQVSLDTITFYDTVRHREIPIAIYKPKTDRKIKNQKIVIISHGSVVSG